MDAEILDIATDREAADRLVDHIVNHTTDQSEAEYRVPISHFISPDRAAAEIALMKSLPLVVGHVSEIPNAHDFVTRDILDTPLLVVRQSDGSVATFRNMCRHRGGGLEEAPSGNRRTFMCRYHGWVYDADGGGLKPPFYEKTFGDIDYSCAGLLKVATEVRHGLIFVTLNPPSDAPALADYLGSRVDDQIQPWRLDRSRLVLEQSVERPINWKLVMDGAIDPLHPQFLHVGPGNVGERSMTNTSVFRTWGRHGKMFAPRSRLQRAVRAGERPLVTSRHVGSVMVIYPNSLFVEAPEHVELWAVWPKIGDPQACRISIRFFLREEAVSDAMIERVHKSWAILEKAALEEDFPMEMSIQRNAKALGSGEFRYGRNELAPQHLHRQLGRDLG